MQALCRYLLQIVAGFALTAIVVGIVVSRLRPDPLFNFVTRAPLLWAIVMILYPILSVYPQGIIYRAFFFQRYHGLFPGRLLLILARAAAFSFVHIIFRNPIAVAFTLVGGLLFARRCSQTQSLLTSSLEHVLYGCLMFTIGRGQYFYKGAR